MKICIVGCGKIGKTLAVQLVEESHDVTVIDTNETVLTELSNSLDVICYNGNGASYQALQDAGVADADLLVAVTRTDEVNMLCCLTAHKLGVGHTAARVRKPEYFDQLYFLRDDIGLSMAINPELTAAREIARLLRFPAAATVDIFAKGRAELVSFTLTAENPLTDTGLRDLQQKTGTKVLVCAIERDGDAIIPDGNTVLKENDTVYLTGPAENIAAAFKKMHMLGNPVKNVMIAGGGTLTYYLASLLSKGGMGVKIIEKDSDRAHDIAARLEKCTVLVGDAADHELLQQEDIHHTDAFCALTGLDEANILSAMYASSIGVGKVITKVSNTDLIPLIRDLRPGSIITPKIIAAGTVVRYVRAMNASRELEHIESLKPIVNGKAEVLEFYVPHPCSVTGIPLKDMKLKKGVLVACIVRKNNVIIPGGSDQIEPQDGLLIVSRAHMIQSLSDILAEA